MDTIATKFEDVKKLSTEEYFKGNEFSIDAYNQLQIALKDANDLCRAAYQIAKRDGKNTNWKSFRDCLSESLDRQHRVMHPKNNLSFHLSHDIYTME